MMIVLGTHFGAAACLHAELYSDQRQ